MHRIFLLLLTMLLPGSIVCFGQATYADSIALHRQHYKEEFIKEERSPLKAADTGFLRFFPADEHYRIEAKFSKRSNPPEIDMATHTGVTKKYRIYGTVEFTIGRDLYILSVFQSVTLMKQEQYKDDLFIPFKDGTNGLTSYGGGRYMDIKIQDIRPNNSVILDFNKAYNPYCAYTEGYACPIPPLENSLGVKIEAGEMMFGKTREED